nr:MAK10-like protein [Tanacetum cinerariifolium]
MGDENPIRTLGDYSKPSHEGYRNTIELPVGNNVVPLRSVTIRLVQNGCLFHGLGSEDPNQHLKDFLKLVDSLDLDGDNRERTRLRLTLKSPSSCNRSLASNIIFYDHVSFHLKCEIDRAANGKLRNKNADESSEIIENLALYDHEGWDDTKEFVKPVKAITTPQGITKTPDQRFLELEDQIKFLLKGSRPSPLSISTHNPQAYGNAAHSSSHPKNQNESPILNSFAFCKRTCPSPQPQALGTTFEAHVKDYMASHTERMERFENAIFKQREEINNKMTEMFRLLKELTTSRTPEKVLIREEAKFPVTKNVNSIPLAREEEERSNKTNVTPDNTEMPIKIKIPVKEVEMNNEVECKLIKMAEEEETTEVPSSQPVEYYLKHGINEKLIKGLVDNHRFNDSLSTSRARKTKRKTYNISPKGPEDEKRPFILGTPFLTTAKAVIKFDEGTITLRSGKSKISFHRIPESPCKIKKGVKNDIEPIAPIMTVNRLVLEWEERIKLHLEKEMKFNQ